jgi:hypothetical protein
VHHATLIIASALALTSPWAGAQTVYRCGSNYSQQPCPGAMAIEAAPVPLPADRAQAAKVAAADAKLADAMEKARLAREKNAPKAVIPPAPPAPVEERKEHAKGKNKGKGDKLEQFSAVSPAPPGEKKPKKKKT